MGIKTTTWSASSNILTGVATIDILVPGDFVTTDTQDQLFSGRKLLQLSAWFEGRAAMDRISAMIVKDTDGVFFPAGTVLGALHDASVPAANQGLAFPPNKPFELTFPDTRKAYIASGLHIIFSGKKSILGVDTLTLNLAWDDLL